MNHLNTKPSLGKNRLDNKIIATPSTESTHKEIYKSSLPIVGLYGSAKPRILYRLPAVTRLNTVNTISRKFLTIKFTLRSSSKTG